MTSHLIFRPTAPRLTDMITSHQHQGVELADTPDIIRDLGLQAVRFPDGLCVYVELEEIVLVGPAPVVLVPETDRPAALTAYHWHLLGVPLRAYVEGLVEAFAAAGRALVVSMGPAMADLATALNRFGELVMPVLREDTRRRRAAMHAAYRRRRR